MEQYTVWYDAPTNEEFAEVVGKMTLDERKEMDRRVNAILGYIPNISLSERLIAKDFLIKGYLLKFIRFATEEEKKAETEKYYETLRPKKV